MRITAQDLTEMGIVDDIIPEPEGGAHLDADNTVRKVGDVILAAIEELSLIPTDQLLAQRYDKYRVIGAYNTVATPQQGHGDPIAF